MTLSTRPQTLPSLGPGVEAKPTFGRSLVIPRLLGRWLNRLACGSLEVQLPDGRTVSGQGHAPGPAARLVLHRWRPLRRLALHGDLGLARSWRDGDWSTPDLTTLLEFGALNEAAWAGASSAAWPWRLLFRLAHRLRDNSRRGSRRNIAFHYDLGNDFYRQWLDEDLIYSSALFGPDARTLEAAQARKIGRIIDLLDLADGQQPTRVLEIGCGWGALACAIARRGASVTGLTLSTEQLAHARARSEREGLSDQVELRLQDYRDAPGQFDRLVSIEMIEAVGERFWPVYFDVLRERLVPGGIAVIQAITIDEAAFPAYRQGADFIQHFIFPGGMLPSPGAMRREAERAGLVLDSVETFGESYAATLAQWRERFVAAWPAIAKLGFDESFRRLWTYYLCYCEAGFRTGRVDVGLYRLRRPEMA